MFAFVFFLLSFFQNDLQFFISNICMIKELEISILYFYKIITQDPIIRTETERKTLLYTDKL